MSNRRIFSLVIVLLVVFVAVSGCRKQVPADPFTGGVGTQNLSAEKVKNSIIRAGAQLGWAIVPSGKNTLIGTLRVRSHTLVMDIDYSPTVYTVRYKSSINMEYQNGMIHPQYHTWMANLQRQIDVELATAGTR